MIDPLCNQVFVHQPFPEHSDNNVRHLVDAQELGNIAAAAVFQRTNVRTCVSQTLYRLPLNIYKRSLNENQYRGFHPHKKPAPFPVRALVICLFDESYLGHIVPISHSETNATLRLDIRLDIFQQVR